MLSILRYVEHNNSAAAQAHRDGITLRYLPTECTGLYQANLESLQGRIRGMKNCELAVESK